MLTNNNFFIRKNLRENVFYFTLFIFKRMKIFMLSVNCLINNSIIQLWNIVYSFI